LRTDASAVPVNDNSRAIAPPFSERRKPGQEGDGETLIAAIKKSDFRTSANLATSSHQNEAKALVEP
jgi:hypothetical protein